MDEKVQKYLRFFFNTASTPRPLNTEPEPHYTFHIRKYAVGHVFHMSSNGRIWLGARFAPLNNEDQEAMREAAKIYILVHRLTDG